MTRSHESPKTTLRVAHSGWDSPLSRPRMSNDEDRHDRFALTNRFVTDRSVPVIPVSGEMHFSRVPRARWDERLRLMKAGGITAVAFYVIWIHHEEVRGEYGFDGNRDVRAFVEMCDALGLNVVLRIGPWAHGEARNGGFPDWIQQMPVVHRTDDPAYLAEVSTWFARIGAELDGLFGSGSNIVGIQIENELYDQPDHIRTLKGLARSAGMSAPIWTSTGWGGAELPEDEVLPVFGGYGDGFWVEHDAPWDSTFREHFFFSHVWDDPGIGADLRGRADGDIPVPRTPSALYPAATCELGGGMTKAYHRRPDVQALDVAAVAHTKIGNGSAWQGYYMYTGGTNPGGQTGMQESHSTGYPNDAALYDYDFNAPIGAAGTVRESHSHLRRQHAFLAAFGETLATMPSTLPDELPADEDDTSTLRWALRSDGTSGFVFITWHQPFYPLDAFRNASFEVALDNDLVRFPHVPVTIPVGTIAHWPVNLSVGDAQIAWATASPLTVLSPGAERQTLVFVAEKGISVQIALASGTDLTQAAGGVSFRDGIVFVESDETVVFTITAGSRDLDIVVVPASTAETVWVLGDGPARRLIFSADPVWVAADGNLAGSTTTGEADAFEYDPRIRALTQLRTTSALTYARPASRLSSQQLRAPQSPPASYGTFENRASAPSDSDFAAYAAAFELEIPEWTAGSDTDAWAMIDWDGDAARLKVDGAIVADQYWAGRPWELNLRDVGASKGKEVVLEILPMHPQSQIGLPATAETRRRSTTGEFASLESVTVGETMAWKEIR